VALATFSINGVPIENYGLYPTPDGSKGWLDIPVRTFKTSPLVMRDGLRPLSPASMSGARAIGLSLRLVASSFQNRRDTLNSLFRALNGKLEIVSVEDPTKVCYGLLVSAPTVFPYAAGAGLATLASRSDVALLCYDPLWYDITPQPTAIGAVNTPVALTMGNASARMRRLLIRISGVVTSPVTLTLKNAAGDALSTMTIAVALTSAEYLDIDCDAFTITKYSGGVATDQLAALTTTQDFFAIDPYDLPTLQLDKGTAMAYYYRAYVA
jgi:hypothetical protein